MFKEKPTYDPIEWINRKVKRFIWYLKSDIDLNVTTVREDGIDKPYAFFFYSKKPRGKRYQFHSESSIEDLYSIKEVLEKGIKANKKGIILVINGGIGREEVEIHKGSMQKALDLINGFYRENPEFILSRS